VLTRDAAERGVPHRLSTKFDKIFDFIGSNALPGGLPPRENVADEENIGKYPFMFFINSGYPGLNSICLW
jgi:hypothetical protein